MKKFIILSAVASFLVTVFDPALTESTNPISSFKQQNEYRYQAASRIGDQK